MVLSFYCSLASSHIVRCTSSRLTKGSVKHAAVVIGGCSNSRSVLLPDSNVTVNNRYFSFCFGGKKLEDIMKLDLLQDKSKEEVEAIWKEYHNGLPDTFGSVLSGDEGKKILMRAKECPFFIQPVFREEGFFTLFSQFQSPSHFILCYLEDYKINGLNAQPLFTMSVYNDLDTKDNMNMNLTLIRGQIIAKGGIFQQDVGEKIIGQLIDAYRNDDEFNILVHAFNKTPDKFDFNDYIARQNVKWNNEVAMKQG